MKSKVIVKCVSCGATRQIKEGEIEEGFHPICSKCYSPMVAEEAQAQGEST